jgi:dienelactone hydrolase
MHLRLPAALLGLVIATGLVQAQSLLREELRIPMQTAGSAGLEGFLARPGGPGRHPLMLINHGSPRNAGARQDMTAKNYTAIADEFARRGFAAAVVMRRGYGSSGGGWAESYGACDDPDYVKAGRAAAADLAATIAFLSQQSSIDASRIMSVGVSAGGFATTALTANAPPGLVAGLNFAGGRGSRDSDDVCEEDELVHAFGTFGKTSRVPMLWVYAQNDTFFGPDLARRMRDAFNGSGGKAELIIAPPYGSEGHTLFSAGGIATWTPYVDRFLGRLAAQPSAAPAAVARTMSPPSDLSANGRRAFEAYLAAPNHKAFAMGAGGSFGWRSGRASSEDAQAAAKLNCQQHAEDCVIISINGTFP